MNTALIERLADDSVRFYFALLGRGLTCERAQALAAAFTAEQARVVLTTPMGEEGK